MKRPMRSSWLSPATLIVATLVALFLAVLPASSYLLDFTNGSPDKWSNPGALQYSINTNVGSNIIGGSGAAASVIQSSFATWNAAPNSAISITRSADTGITAHANDGVNLICFVCSADFTKDSSTLAVTYQWASGTQLVEADILFNPSVTYVTNGAPGDGQSDLQTVATHEIGHFLGLNHSAVVRAAMFPFAPDVLTTLSYDDVAGLSRLYPKASADVATGSISGSIKFATGSGVFGAHVFANSATNTASVFPNVRKSVVGGFTRTDGSYTIDGLPPDSYVVGVEPVDLPVTDDDLRGFASSFGQQSVQTNFNTRWH